MPLLQLVHPKSFSFPICIMRTNVPIPKDFGKGRPPKDEMIMGGGGGRQACGRSPLGLMSPPHLL